ncbi:mechanosensitive ion channel family protein [bacterium]|nr:mechanosensitive ion channel family protein [bacterium]MBU1637148.1 mechanosensitive ion channel family protein [bacterium]MBU1920860.1 mechanosensitive ion channel family protein [bacterium]
MQDINNFFDGFFLGIKMSDYGLAFACILGGYVLRVIVMAVIRRMVRLSEKTDNMYDDIIIEAVKKPVASFCLLLGIWGAMYVLPLPTEPIDIQKFVDKLLQAASIVLFVWLGIRISNGFGRYFEGRAREATSPMAGFIPVGRKSINMFLVIIGALLVVQNLGYSITSLLAGVGIGGMAMAFAARDTLANLFGSLVVFIDRPFHVGDWVKIGDMEGTVEELNLRVTRFRTFENSQITMPNAMLTTTSIENWTRRQKRRIKMVIGVTYDTPADKLKAAVAKIRELIESDDRFHHDLVLVNFNEFNAYSLDISVYCFTKTVVWKEYLEVREELLLKIKTEFEQLGVEFAFPTQSLHVESLNLPDKFKN